MEAPDTMLLDPKEVEITSAFFADDEGSAIIVQKRRRRVSFAQTQTIHVIPRKDEFDTPPESHNGNTNVPSQSPKLQKEAGTSVNQIAMPTGSPTSSFHSEDQNDTPGDAGSWRDNVGLRHHESFDSMESDSDGPVHIWRLSKDGRDNSIVNEDLTLDAATMSVHLSRFLDTSTEEKTFDSQGIESRFVNVTPPEQQMELTNLEWRRHNTDRRSPQSFENMSHMSLVTACKEAKWQEKDEPSPLVNGLSNTPPHSAGRASSQKSISRLHEGKENLPPRKLQSVFVSKVDRAEAIHSFNTSVVCVDDILQTIEGESLTEDFQISKEEMTVPLSPQKLETLNDGLRFSIITRPQLVWLCDYVREQTEKLANAKRRNAEIKSSKFLFQKLAEEPRHKLQLKFKDKLRLASKEWLLLQLKHDKEKLAYLQETKETLIGESEACRVTHQEVLEVHKRVLHLQSIVLLKVSSPTSSSTADVLQAPAATFDEDFQHLKMHVEKMRNAQREVLDKRQRHYQDACERLMISRAKLSAIEGKIKDIASIYYDKLQCTYDKREKDSFIQKLEGVGRKLLITSKLLEEQQLMDIKFSRNVEGKSQTEFSLGDIYYQRLVFEEDGPVVQVNISRCLGLEAIERAFPCMQANLAFEYTIRELNDINQVPIQNIQRLVQQTNWLLGNLLDILREIKYARNNFRLASKFLCQPDGEVQLRMTFFARSVEQKLVAIFNMGFLRRGLYPVDLAPFEVQIVDVQQPALLTVEELNLRIAKLKPAFGRLLGICGCIGDFMDVKRANQVS